MNTVFSKEIAPETEALYSTSGSVVEGTPVPNTVGVAIHTTGDMPERNQLYIMDREAIATMANALNEYLEATK